MRHRLKFIDLFAGLGGFHLALARLGCECVFASELREDLRKLYAINFPGTPIFGDLTKISPSDIPSHDILCGGFPCQPFSQAGKRQGFNDDKSRGNLFSYICDIIAFHRPKYIFLENVANLKGHDGGNTWNVIYHKLNDSNEDGGLNYEVREAILSPHEFGIPQHRKRIYIVAVNRDCCDLKDFEFPTPTNEPCSIDSIVDSSDTDIVKLKSETRQQLSIWQEFIDNTLAAGDVIPRFPIWAMEFGATYEFEDVAPAFQTLAMLNGKKGKLGKTIHGTSIAECLSQLPNYAQASGSSSFPSWKVRYIQQNREFYQKHKKWLDKWLLKVQEFENSHLKFEWNCGDSKPTLFDKIIQYRASGIRVKNPTFSPALNLVGTQIPILPWVKIPKKFVKSGEPNKGRYMTVKECASLQGMEDLVKTISKNNYPLTRNRTLEALGNAVNVNIVESIARNLLKI